MYWQKRAVQLQNTCIFFVRAALQCCLLRRLDDKAIVLYDEITALPCENPASGLIGVQIFKQVSSYLDNFIYLLQVLSQPLGRSTASMLAVLALHPAPKVY